MQEYGLYLNVGSLLALLVAVASGVWKLSRVEKEVRQDMGAQVDNVQRDIAKLEREGSRTVENLRHETGETGAALRTKIHEMEVFSRDTFVRKDSFEIVIARIEKSFEKGIDKLETKIDRALDRFQNPYSD